MKRSRNRARFAAAGGLLLLAAASAPIAVGPAGAQERQCFRAMDWRSSAAADARTLYIRVGMHDIWRLTMAQDCPGARFPGPVSIGDLVTGNNEICSAADLQITVKPRGGSNAVACIVKSIARLSPDEVKALPRKAIPD